MSAAAFRRVYGWAHLGKSLTWYFSELLFAYFLTEICGLSPPAMGVALVASLVFSAVVDVVAGTALSRQIASVERACALQFPGAVASGGALIAFSATALVTPGMRLVYAICCGCLFRLAYAFYDLPQNSLLALVRGSDEVRIRLSAIRLSYSGVAAAILAVATALLIGSDRGHGWIAFLMFSVLLAVVGVVSARALAVNIAHPQHAAPAERVPSRDSTSRQARALWTLLGLVFVVAGSAGVFGRLEAYFAAAALESAVARTVVLVSIALGGAAGQPAWAWLLRTHTLRDSFRAAAAMLAVGSVMFFCAGRNTVASAFAGMIYGCGLGGVNLVLWSAIASVVASEPGRSGATSPTVAFGLLTGCCKLAAALSVLGISVLLGRIDYHSPVVASSWLLLAPMAGAPLASALICFLSARALTGPEGYSSRSGAALRV
jgi:Na+/melibiose symporter-like transporter